MEEIFFLPEALRARRMSHLFNPSAAGYKKRTSTLFIDKLIAEGGEIFFHYLNGLGLAYKPNMMLLSSRNNCFYDSCELKGLSVLVHLKPLNKTMHLSGFLGVIRKSASTGTLFTGCFRACDNSETGQINKNSNKRFSDTATTKCLNRDDVEKMLVSGGFLLLDMTEIKGLTYFLVQI